ncbi:hypothetical protein CL618_02650 [archaeon]|nr:hypothetical protein [archaeon]|tara:strand:+ start:325 stop:675 length:351 start_codon:yes stop_codon:yes gene_type:complete
MEESKKEKLLVNLSSLFILLNFVNLVGAFFASHYSAMGLLSFGVTPIAFLVVETIVLDLFAIIFLIASIFPLIAFISSYMAYKLNKLNKTNLIISVVFLSWQIISIITHVAMYIFE